MSTAAEAASWTAAPCLRRRGCATTPRVSAVRLPHFDDAISPTGHFTGYTWVRAGWSDPALATRTGKVLADAVRLPEAVNGRLGLPTLHGMLLGRHRVIDTILTEAIEDGRVEQVVELACGLSPRGLTFTRRYGDRLTYLEADLPAMAGTKRRLLEQAGPLHPGHRVVEVDAFAEAGPRSLAAVTGDLDPTKGTAVITEGLLNYFPTASVLGLWRRIGATLRHYPTGLYLADIGLRAAAGHALLDGFIVLLEAVVGSRVSFHFADTTEVQERLGVAGFASGELRPIADWPAAAPWASDPANHRFHVLAATTVGESGRS